jgi:signal transduction histidine kinase
VKRISATIAAAVACLCTALPAKVFPYRTLAEASRKTPPEERFSVTGEVMGATSYTYILRDKTGMLQFRNWSPVRWSTGDVVHVKRASYRDGANLPIAHISEIVSRRSPVTPIDILPGDFDDPIPDLSIVHISGVLTDLFRDELDPCWTFFILEKNGARAVVTHYTANAPPIEDFLPLLDAEISVTGIFRRHCGNGRRYLNATVSVYTNTAIAVIRPAPSDPFTADELPSSDRNALDEARRNGHRHRISGIVRAAWGRCEFLLDSDDGRKIRVKVMPNTLLPTPGDIVDVSGFIRINPYFLRLTNAVFRKRTGTPAGMESPIDVTARELLTDTNGLQRIEASFDGRFVRLQGRVIETLTSFSAGKITALDCDGHRVPVIMATDDSVPPDGAIVDVTGLCLFTESTGDDVGAFPHLTGFSLVTRTADDIRVVRNPPWWTPRKFIAVIILLTAALATGLVWIRALHRLVERRSRELMRKQVAVQNAETRRADRTRLAVELHDSLSQNLAAVALQISSADIARSLNNPSAQRGHLEAAKKMIDSCRTELKNCLCDLRGDMLEEHDFDTAVRKTVDSVLNGAAAEISFRIVRSRMDDITAHAVLMIIRELVSNAVRHGKARNVRIRGASDGERMRFSVSDDGCGFPSGGIPGIREGHFGIEGIRHRLSRFDGTLDITASPEGGAAVTATIRISHPAHPHNEQTA